METSKKASELLLELEQKIDLMLGYLKTNDLNNKLIIARLDKLFNQSVTSATNTYGQTTISAVGINNIAPHKLIPKSADLNLNEVDENNQTIIHEELQPQVGRRDLRTPGQSKRKTQVQHKVSYPDGKPVILANVEVSDIDNKVVKETKTNHTGRWTASLEPGKYFIKIYKAQTSNKPLVELRLETEIPASDTPLEL